MNNPRRLAEWANKSIFTGQLCEICKSDRYYTCNGRCVECQRLYAKVYISPKTKIVNARAAFIRDLLAERNRVLAERRANYAKPKGQRVDLPIMFDMNAARFLRNIERIQDGKCAYCGESKQQLILDVLNVDLKPTWANLNNLQGLCPAHKVAKRESGLSDREFRRAAGVPPSTEWDLI